MKANISTLISETAIATRVLELAEEINRDYQGKSVTLICVLKGAVIFMVDLAKKLDFPIEFDFLDISSYGDEMVSSGTIKINKDLENSIEGKHVLLVEDIIDTGRSLSHIFKHLACQNPASLKLCALLDKPDRRVVYDTAVDYLGFTIPDEFVIGYGLDYQQKYRNLPYVGVLHIEEGSETQKE